MNKVRILVQGMNCNHCKLNVEMNLKKIRGIDTAVADIVNGEVLLTGDPVDLDQVRSTLQKIGYAYGGLG
ncbi:MAG TPA: cation transporter [Bacteroidales bacterium]|nr:cation transporter [Bacteroidales bacterium]